MLSAVIFVNRCGSMVLPFMTLYLTSQLAMSEAFAGGMISIYGLGAIFGSYLGGRFSETLGAIRLQTICLFLSVPCILVIPLWNHWLLIGLSLFCLSTVSNAVRPANAAAIAKLTSADNRVRAFALQRTAANFGFSFGPAIGGVLATINYVLLFVVDALTTLLAACAMVYFFRMRRYESSEDHDKKQSTRVSPRHDHLYVLYLALMLASSIVFFQFLCTYPLYLRDHFHLSKLQIGLMFAVNTLVIVVFEMVLVDFVKRWPLVRTIGWGCFLSCLGFGILPFGSSISYCVLAMLVLTVGEMLSVPLSAGFVANRSPLGSEGIYMGWYTTMFAIASVLGPAIGATIYDIHRDAVWYGSLVVGVVVLLGFLRMSIWSQRQ